MLMRRHQIEFSEIINGIIAGSDIKTVLAHVVPGGGKSALPIIASKLIYHGLADKICWICPRKSLQDQGERSFMDPFFRNMFSHNLTIRSSTNEMNPCRGLHGFTTTYQAIGMDKKQTVLRDFSAKKYVLVLDEFHHNEAGGIWHKALAPIVEKAAFLVPMTGTLARGDSKPIAWMEYKKSRPVLEDGDQTRAVVRYGREIALREKAILPIKFTLADGHVEWKDGESGSRKSGQLSRRIIDVRQALFVALSTEFSNTLLDNGVDHWRRYKSRCPRSKLLIVTANFNHAKKIAARLEQHGLHAKIATSHDSPKAIRNIHDFKLGRLDILVSIQMAYEGLDVPQITHIICLTSIRSEPWIEQCVARAVRVDPHAGPYETQMAHVFAPDDLLFRKVVKGIESEQVAIIKKPHQLDEEKGNGGGAVKSFSILPVGSALTGERTVFIGGGPLKGDVWSPGAPVVPETPTNIEQDLRRQIEKHVKEFCFKNYYKAKRINAEIKSACGKSRAEMSLSELRNILGFVRNAYPINGKSAIPQVSQPRGRGRRKSAKVEEVEPPMRQGSLWG